MEKNQNNIPRFTAFFISSVFLGILTFASGTRAMSIDEETKLGEQFMSNVKNQIVFIDDDFANEYITDLGNYIAQSIETKPFPLNFYLINENQVNAFATYAGHIFVYAGLINIMDDADQLAGVMAHEMGHVVARHLSRQSEQSKLVGIGTMAGVLAGAMIGGEVADALIVGSLAAGTQTMLSYTRDAEREADQFGFKLAHQSGFKSDALIEALANLQQTQWGVSQAPAYLLTHPLDSERMSNLEAISHHYAGSTLPETEEAERFRRLYPFFRTIVRVQSTDPKVAERHFVLELEKSPDSSLAHLGLAMALQKKGEYSGSIEHYNIALKDLPEKGFILRYLGETYDMNGQTRDAINTFEKALEINNRDKSTLYLLAMTYQEIEEYAKAVEIYDRLSLMSPVKDDVFYNLGLCLGRQNNLGLAHYNFGIYFRRQGDRENAEFHFKKANELAGNNLELKEKIKKETEEIKEKRPMTPPSAS